MQVKRIRSRQELPNSGFRLLGVVLVGELLDRRKGYKIWSWCYRGWCSKPFGLTTAVCMISMSSMITVMTVVRLARVLKDVCEL